MVTTGEQPAEDRIRANVAQIAEAVNTTDLEKYGRSVTDDFVDMNRNLRGEVTSTVGRQARLDVLKAAFEHGPHTIKALMDPVEIAVDGDRGFARVDGTLTLTPKKQGSAGGFSLTLDIYLFFRNVEGRGWQCERSMGIEKSRADV